MTVLEIVAGVMLMIACVVLILVVLSQESKGQGLSGIIQPGNEMMGESRARGREARQSRITKVCAVVFFVLTLAVNMLSVFASV